LNRNEEEHICDVEASVEGDVTTTRHKSPTTQKAKRRVRAFTESEEEDEGDDNSSNAQELNRKDGEFIGRNV
jgi:hypothetical protein